jgi:hypothetical protein
MRNFVLFLKLINTRKNKIKKYKGTSSGLVWTVTSLYTYASNCRFSGNDCEGWSRASSHNECVNKCIRLDGCTAYIFFEHGVCALKYGFSSTSDASSTTEMTKCGLVTSKTLSWSDDKVGTFASQCDFPHNDIQCVPSGSIKDCIRMCMNTDGCTAYTFWDLLNAGTCCLKKGLWTPTDARINITSTQCGIIASKNLIFVLLIQESFNLLNVCLIYKHIKQT